MSPYCSVYLLLQYKFTFCTIYPINVIGNEQFMLIKELIEICPENNMEHINTQ